MRFSEYCAQNNIELDSDLIGFILIVLEREHIIPCFKSDNILGQAILYGLKKDTIDLKEEIIKPVIDHALKYKKNAAFI